MDKLSIPQDALIFVGDGQKALFLRNKGDSKFPNLRMERVFGEPDPPTHDQGTDRPGRAFQSVGPGRSSVEMTDWHRLEKDAFADHVAAALEKLVHAGGVKAIVVVAPPRTLAELRHAFHADVKSKIIAEVDKDLTKHPVWDIEKHLVG
jgi:protein required for attachment to host cells